MATRKRRPEIDCLYYITHIDNLPSILKHGIQSHNAIEKSGIDFKAVYDPEIMVRRKSKSTPNGRTLWDFANVYFQPRNPMLYRVINEIKRDEIAVLGLQPSVLRIPGIYITDGNAANDPTSFYTPNVGLKIILRMWDTIDNEWWNSADGSKRKIMAECLIPQSIPPTYIHSIFVAKHEIADLVKRNIAPLGIPVIPQSKMFFLPERRFRVTNSLSLLDGDMFFSEMQTLTVSVNVVGIMGKGLASRAKYQFPDVYVVYQDACRSKSLKIGKPYLYKRESSFDTELVDEPGDITTMNGVKWFLLFATKRHWREDSDLASIEEGLRWLLDNYEAEGIKSIALPALGCGLGNLEWKDVGPIMCRYLSKMKINAGIYLPREKQIPEEFLTTEYLLS